ncbi:MAG: sulfite exporter TauE/SafE family protein [Pseudomonadota bacterium]
MIDALGIGWQAAALTLATFFVGGITKGGFGFGLPLVTISLLPLFLPLDLALVLNALVLPPLNVWQVAAAGRVGETLSRFWPLGLTLALTLPLGVALGAQVSPDALTVALGIAIVLFSAFNLANPRLVIPDRWEQRAGALTGIGAGIVGGLTTINGPFFILFLVGRGADRRMLLSGLGVFFLLTGVLLTGSFWAVGLLDWARLLAALACIVPSVLGMVVGNRIGRRIPQDAFRRAVLILLILLGANIALRGLL